MLSYTFDRLTRIGFSKLICEHIKRFANVDCLQGADLRFVFMR
jgi:hypothetical protein